MSARVNDSALAGARNMLSELMRTKSRIVAPIAAKFNAYKDKQWRAGQDLYGRPWAPLAASTIKRKRGDARILIRSDILRPASRFIARAGSGIAFVVGESGIHAQRGDPTRNRPAREIVPTSGLPATMRAMAITITKDDAKKTVRR